jgi:hypothetical protein
MKICIKGSEEVENMGILEKILGKEKTETPGTAIYALRALRKVTSGVSQVQDLPAVLPEAGPRGSHSGRAEGQLVRNVRRCRLLTQSPTC